MSNLPSGACAMTALGMPFSRISAVSARVSMPAMRDDAAPLQPLVEMAGGAVVRRVGDVGLEDRADRAGAGGRGQVLDVLVIGADIADMREGEGDDLAGVGRIGEDFLVAGQRRVEADFGDRASRRAEPAAFDHRAVGKHQQRGRLLRSSRGRSLRPCGLSIKWRGRRRPSGHSARKTAGGPQPMRTSRADLISPCKARTIGEGSRAVNDRGLSQ